MFRRQHLVKVKLQISAGESHERFLFSSSLPFSKVYVGSRLLPGTNRSHAMRRLQGAVLCRLYVSLVLFAFRALCPRFTVRISQHEPPQNQTRDSQGKKGCRGDHAADRNACMKHHVKNNLDERETSLERDNEPGRNLKEKQPGHP